MTRFAFLTDLHFGFERRAGHKVPLHDLAAFGAAFAFLEDFKPQTIILGGDMLDCGVISHHNRGKPGRTEGLRLLSDAEACRTEIIAPLEGLGATRLTYLTGNHERWIDDLIEIDPGIEGLVDLTRMLGLRTWDVRPQGDKTTLGKLTFIHGDQLSGGEHIAKSAVTTWARNIRFGHLHTFQAFTKNTPVDQELGQTGIAVPCLCRKGPGYGRSKANRWVQGLNWGYVLPDGTFHDYVSVITKGRMVAGGKVYRG